MIPPGVRIVQSEKGSSVFVDGKVVAGVTGVSVDWFSTQRPLVTLTVTGFLEEYTDAGAVVKVGKEATK